jgi:hypothetical protein
MDVGTLKNLQADTIRILVWVMAFMSFGYATEEYEVTGDRLGVYRPEEHIEFVLSFDHHLQIIRKTIKKLLTQWLTPPQP